MISRICEMLTTPYAFTDLLKPCSRQLAACTAPDFTRFMSILWRDAKELWEEALGALQNCEVQCTGGRKPSENSAEELHVHVLVCI